MQFKIPYERDLLCALVSLSLLPLAGAGMAQDETAVEEVIVTGSYIRRSEGFNQASSVVQFTAEDLEAEGTLNLGEVVSQLTFVNGDASQITNTIQGQDSRSTTIDLRGLGARSTLTLLDGKRLVNENILAMIPTIAIQRMDIVADGNAALYGNEAVSGVVNIVPYTSYDGFRIESFAEGDSRGDYDEHSVQFLWGGEVGGIDVVLAGQFHQNSRLAWNERNIIANSGLVISSNAPGNWFVPQRNAEGQLRTSSEIEIRENERDAYLSDDVAFAALGQTGLQKGSDAYNKFIDSASYKDYVKAAPKSFTPAPHADPSCAPGSERTDYTPGVASNAYGMRLGSNCYFDFGDQRSAREPLEKTQLFANLTYDVNDDLTLSFQGHHTRIAERTYTSTSNPGNSRIGELPMVRGEIPGNPFRACKGGGFDRFNPFQCQNPADALFGVDYDGDGLPDRGVDANGDGLADHIVHPNGWIPLYEDVIARTLRPINKTHTLSHGHSVDAANLSDDIDHVSRYSFEADFTIPFLNGWQGTAAYTHGYRERQFMSNQNYDITAMIQGLNCDVVKDRSACYSPFLIVDPEDNNSVHVMNAVAGRSIEVIEDKLTTVDIILNGELPLGGFELPGGPVGAAIGYQFRDDKYLNIPSEEEIAGVTWIGSENRQTASSGARDIDAFFAEFALPVLDNLEVELAVRHEKFSTGQSATVPEFGVTFAPLDWLVLRATTGEAFIAPTLEQLLNPVTCGLGTVSDPFSNFEAWTTTCGGGNPNLDNETSDSKQFGFDIAFNDFDFSATWVQIDFQNRIVDKNAQDLLDEEFKIFKQATGFSGDGENVKPDSQELQAWVNDPRSNKQIIRSDNDVSTILQICCRGSINAEFVKVTAMDFDANYTFGFDNIGDFRIGLRATYVEEYLVQANPESPVTDAAGGYNYRTGAAPELPHWKANLRMGWTNGNHSVVSTVHYIDDLPYDGPAYSHMDRFAGFYRPGNIFDTGIHAWTDMDIAYTYRGLALFDGEMAMTIGSRNVFDREPQRSPEFMGVVGGLQDVMGRVLYARMVYDF